MRLKRILPALLLIGAAGCESFLDVEPANEVSGERAVSNPTSARAAAAGMYDALQSGSYYGGEFIFFGDLSAEDVEHTGTFTDYADADANDLTADNGSIENIWDALYRTVGRANFVIARVPGVAGIDADEKEQLVGEAYFVRALAYHDLVKTFGGRATGDLGVPIITEPVTDLSEASRVTRQSVGDVYTRIMADLAQAEQLIVDVNGDRSRATLGAVRALRARVELYRGNWAAAETEAARVINTPGYDLAANYADLFSPDGAPTSEDIFRLVFTAQDANSVGFYYRSYSAGGRGEIGPTADLLQIYDSSYVAFNADTYNPTDARGIHNIDFDFDVNDAGRDEPFGSKYPTGIGAEDIHVIRLAEVILIKAEAHARQGELTEALAEVNKIRARAGLPLLVGALTQAQVIEAILLERRRELAFEGHRWHDLVRLGLAESVLDIVTTQTRYPIPQNEVDVAPGLVQNPGY